MKLLILMTNRTTLHLLDGEIHPTGFWAEEFVVPYKRFKQAGYDLDIATIGGIAPTMDKTSIDPQLFAWVRPAGIPADDQALAKEYMRVIEAASELKQPLNVNVFTKEQIALYNGIYLCGGHGAIGDMPKSDELAQLFRWALALNKPIAAVCHGHCGLLALRDGQSNWPFAGYHMTAFSHNEELVTDMAGRLPFVLEQELKRLGALYEKADVPWASHVVVDRNLITGQNPYSSAALAEAFIQKLATVTG